ncbi:MAG TPA: hypothetical protein VL463_16000 [Kofleriaceae bacterium]|jgi:hypothetical protein|nr:hypothetical protein [Kofleriaceae bacterium]
MRQLYLLAAVLVVGCGAAPPAPVVHPAAVAISPQDAAAVARQVIDARYGVDPGAGSDRIIVGRAEWLNDAQWIARRWERGMIVRTFNPEGWFRVVAVVENPRPGEVAVRVIGLAANGDERFDGLEQYIVSGDPRMPRWADNRVAVLQLVINKKLHDLH